VFVVDDSTGLSEPAAPSTTIPDRPRTVVMRPVEVLAEGRSRAGLRGVEAGEWVVTLGQHLVYRSLEAGSETQARARVRPTSWDRVLGLQQLQREDLLEGFLAKQRALARVLGPELPASIEAVDQALAEAHSGPASRPQRGAEGS
jgi:hypothetical protein